MASDAERASIKYKQVEFMSRMEPGRTFAGVISGVTEFGIFVEITENSCEGLVRMQDLSDDFYEYDKDNYRIIGQRNKKMYTFGDQVEVRVKETNLARRSMDFLLVSDKAGRATDMGRDVTFGGRRRSDRGEERNTKSSRGSRSGSSSSRSSSSRQEGPAAKGQNRRGGRGRR
jgi:ribonuclease R